MLSRQLTGPLLFCLLLFVHLQGIGSPTKEYSNEDRERIVAEAVKITRCAAFAKYDSAMIYIMQMLDQYQDFDFAKGIIYMRWSNLERMRGNKTAAISKGWEAMGYAKRDTSIKLRFHLSLALAGLYMEQGPPDSCKFYAESALALIDQIAALDPNMSKASCYQFLADAEKKSKNYAQAKRYLAFCEEVYDDPGYISYLPMTLMNLAIVKLEENPNADVHEDLDRALAIADSIRLFSHQTTLLRFMVDYHAKRQEYDPAFKYLQRQVKLEDSAKVATQEQMVKDLETKYKTEQKEAENKLLKQTNEAKSNENHQLLIFNIVVGSALAFALVLLILLLFSRRKIKRQKEELQRLGLLNQKIFAVISHDFKGPLIALQSMIDLLEGGLLDAASMEEFTGDLKQQISQTVLILENLLNWARTELQLQIGQGSHTEAAAAVEEVVLQLRQMITAKELKVRNEIPLEVRVGIPKDIATIVLRNLLSNAIKYSEPGQTIRFTYNAAENTLSVIDEGKGMPAEKMKDLFVGATTSEYGTRLETGFGLGLYITATLIRKFGGNIAAMHNLGKGMNFSLYLPKMHVNATTQQS